MKFCRSGLIEFLVFLAATAALTTLHSRPLDNTMAIVWLVILAAASLRLFYMFWRVRTEPDALRRLNASRWSAVLPPRVMSWMMGQTGKNKSE
jgi:hypothetical protein